MSNGRIKLTGYPVARQAPYPSPANCMASRTTRMCFLPPVSQSVREFYCPIPSATAEIWLDDGRRIGDEEQKEGGEGGG